jgi:hypothetical protein
VPEGREFGLRLHGNDVRAVLEGRIGLEQVKFSGALRYFSPHSIEQNDATLYRLFLPLYLLVGG